MDDYGFSDSLHELEIQAKLNLNKVLEIEESFWKQKSNLNWFTSGDRNIGFFFHRVSKVRQTIKQMSTLKNGNVILYSESEIEQHVLDFYTNLDSSDNSCSDNGIMDKAIPTLISPEDNAMLIAIPTAKEVKSAMFSMNGLGALGPDGFGGCFYQTFWDIVGVDVCHAVLQFL